MATILFRPDPQRIFNDDQQRWKAVVNRDRSADDMFVYSVSTTGVYCRPTCAARLARRDHVRFYNSPADAEQAGFRPCKRCRPNAMSMDREHAQTIARACRLIDEADEAPDLQTLARTAGLSASHFHRVFKTITGLTPKRYAAAHRVQRMREALSHSPTVTAAIYQAGFNSSGRFYTHSSKALGMTPSSFRAGGAGMKIQFAVGECSLGLILVAASPVGICAILLGENPGDLARELQGRFPRAELLAGDRQFERTIAQVVAFVERPSVGLDLPLDVQGTAFQQRVWQELSQIPPGTTRSYAEIARRLGQPNATRAIAGACAANRLAVAIPCHRVVRTDGALSGYRWGVERKARLLKIERDALRQ